LAGKRKNSSRRGDRKEQILEAAREVFSQKGYNEVTVADITSQAGIAKGTLYLYWKSKEDLFLEVIRDATQRLRFALVEAAGEVDDPLERVRVSVPVIFDFCRREAGLYLAIFQQASFLQSERQEEYNALYEPLAEDFKRTIEEGSRRGIFKVDDPEVISHGVYGFLASLIYQWLLLESAGGAPEDYAEEMPETISRFFCCGLIGEAFPEPGELSEGLRAQCRHQLEEIREWQRELVRLEKILRSYT
jgi:AcrR family transcriptional regulator